ncbi:TetR/AcrR family transcriptional regulator [Zestomonas carbonaria]|uniref:Nucleoid occlusion factor SlmA n=1 Tax=Zestomonas carbonaria TaxID=2762745 RepID=A0A7U7ELY7_9GAMM|nr:TetR family transcriptional regulator [Pseudomonas carbonaria]CAD5107068.1 Nucleoid occlusion factor SlmA [Pseudomonas carbonaria]
MGVSRQAAPADGGHTYELIRRSAFWLIGQRGFEAMSMRQLAETVGIQAGSLYRYFPSKHSLLFELICEYYEDLLASWQETRPRSATVEAELAAFVDHHLDWHRQRRGQGALIDPGEARSLEDSERARVRQLGQGYAGELRRIIDDGVRQGSFRADDPALLGQAILALLDAAWREQTNVGSHAHYRALALKLLR